MASHSPTKSVGKSLNGSPKKDEPSDRKRLSRDSIEKRSHKDALEYEMQPTESTFVQTRNKEASHSPTKSTGKSLNGSPNKDELSDRKRLSRDSIEKRSHKDALEYEMQPSESTFEQPRIKEGSHSPTKSAGKSLNGSPNKDELSDRKCLSRDSIEK